MNPLAIWETVKSTVKLGQELAEWLRKRNLSPAVALNALLACALALAVTGRLEAIMRHFWPPPPEVLQAEELEREAIQARRYLNAVRMPFVDFLWDRRWKCFNAHLLGVQAGRIIVEPSEVLTVAVEMLRSGRVQQTLTATSSTKGWWDTPEGNSYEQLNYRLIEGNVRIKRIFLYEDPEELAQLRAIMERERNRGIIVLSAQRDPNMPEMANDYVVLDGKCAGVLRLTPKREMIQADFVFDAGSIVPVQDSISKIELRAEPIA